MYSKATAALNRLKEIDRKYNIKSKEVKSPEVSVSTESTLNSSISSPRTLKIGVNERSKTGLKTKLEVQMQNIYTKDFDSNNSRESGSTESSKAPLQPILNIETEQTDLNILLDKYEASNNTSKKLFDTSRIKKGINGRAEEKSEYGSSFEESIVSTIIGKLSENSSERNVGSSMNDRKQHDAPEATIREQNNKNENDFGNSSATTIDEVIGTEEGSEIISELSRSTENDKKLRAGSSSGSNVSVKNKKLYVENVYASDTFENITSSTEFVKSRDDLREIKAQSDVENGGGDSVMSGVKGVKISPYKQLEQDEEDVNNVRAKRVVEIVAPKPMQTNSECELGLDDELSNYVKNIEKLSDESNRLTPISLLRSSSSSRKPRRVKKHEKRPKENTNENTNESSRAIVPIDDSLKAKTNQHKEKRSVRKNPKMTPRNELNVEKINTSKFETDTFIMNNNKKLLNAKEKSANKYSEKIGGTSESSIISEVTEADESENETESKLSAGKTKQIISGRRKSARNEEEHLSMINDSVFARNKVINVDIERKASKENRSVERETADSTLGDSFPGEFTGKLMEKEDATMVLRKLNRDAIDAIARRHRIARIESEKPGDNCTSVAKRSGNPEGKIGSNEKSFSFAENVKTSSGEHGNKRRKSKVQMKASKSGKVHKTISHVRAEEKSSRFECKQMHHHLRKKMAALRLQEERLNIGNYFLELEKAKMKLDGTTFDSSKVSVFKPLEFPKIMEFEKPNSDDLDLKSADVPKILQDRVLTIRQWLKDQYILYRKYSELAQTLNAKYVPSSLEDAKETIRQLRAAVDKVR